MNIRIHPSWVNALQEEFAQPYFANLVYFVKAEYASTTVYPPANLIFNAFDHCPLGNVKVVILGQDPYHEPNQAQGLAFSVPDGVRIPPSLVNIYKEIASDTGR
ncbi:MAG: uracil-DNA glycosylase, partial [Bacteroidales bacterium]|nr:uracil-DNA glycosylase [Bacteroidales bacterium]